MGEAIFRMTALGFYDHYNRKLAKDDDLGFRGSLESRQLVAAILTVATQLERIADALEAGGAGGPKPLEAIAIALGFGQLGSTGLEKIADAIEGLADG